jgi:3'(2'), 5'-bisphosphate nucleotidase
MNNMNNIDISWLDINKIVEIIELASQIVLQIYLSDSYFIENKVDNSPLTIADKKANDFICSELLSIYPHIPIISEENKNDDWEKRKKYSWAWLIDPVDGTKEFIKKNGEFTVNIGLVYNGIPVAGFVGIPAKGLIYWGICSGNGSDSGNEDGAWMKSINDDDDKIINIIELHKNKIVSNNKKKRVVASRSHIDEKTKKYIDSLGNIDLINVGSSIKILWIAENKADIYPRIGPTMEWDTCASHAILKAAGGNISIYTENNTENEELKYNKENLLNPYFIAKFK